MSRLSEVIEYIHKNPIGHEQEWEKLRDRIMSNNDSKEYWFTLLKDVEDFFDSNAPENQKKKLEEYMEHLGIMIDAYDETYWDK